MSDPSTGPRENPSPPQPPDERAWRFEVEPHVERRSAAVAATERPRDRSWLRLLVQHMPFEAASEAEYSRLIGALREIEHVFIDSDEPALHAYYREAYLPPLREAALPTSIVAPPGDAREPDSVQHVVMLQAQLMEEVFYGLRLDRYANAPDNRGWMNLFRRWGRSPTFNARFDGIRALLTREFVAFYDSYLRGYEETIDVEPVPHPWDDVRPLELPPLPPDEDEGLEPPSPGLVPPSPPPRGVFLDSGIHEARPVMGRSDTWVAKGSRGGDDPDATPPRQKTDEHPQPSPPPADAGGSGGGGASGPAGASGASGAGSGGATPND